MSDGGSAFPMLERSYEDRNDGGMFHESSSGMTLRDYFAAKAITAAMATPWRDIGYQPADGLNDIQQHARIAYQMADAMLVERSKP